MYVRLESPTYICGACASDLAGDTWIDLSCGWCPVVPIIEACK
jgi:hypothetical protein